MKNLLRITTLIFSLFLLTNNLKAQEQIFVEGQEVVCPGQCEYYYIFSPTGTYLDSVIVTGFSANPGMVWIEEQQNPNETSTWLLCFDVEPGTYEFLVTAFVDGVVVETSFTVWVDFMEFIEIQTDAKDLCPGDAGNSSCDKVCEFSTVTYYAEGFGTEYFWSVSGAESYVDNFDHIIVTWGAAGPGLITLESWGQGCSTVRSKCVEILPTPEAAFETIPDLNSSDPVCKGQEIYLTNNSTGAVYFQWDFGNGETSEEASPSIIYNASGDYTITLIALNECLCGDTTSLDLTILDTQSPFVDCVGTICENETVTYTSDAACGTFSWNISSNGSITDGGGTNDNFVTVDWGAGPKGLITLEVSSCTNNYCLEPAVVIVPIMSDNALIEGPERVCKGSTEQYHIQDYSATYYDWSVTGGTIIAGQGTSLITVEWSSPVNLPSNQSLTVLYDNCYLDCGGFDQLDINIVDEFYFYGPAEVCEGSIENYTSRSVTITGGPVLANWSLQDEGGLVVWTSSSPTASPDVEYPEVPGLYMLLATAVDMDEYCNDQYKMCISVIERTAPADAINGDLSICPGSSYQYSAVSLLTNASFNWTITGGDVSTAKGQDILVTWNASGPYGLSVSQTDFSKLPCESLPIDVVPNAITGLGLVSSTTSSCVDDLTNFTASLLEVSEYEWTITPSDAGTVVTDEHNSIDVVWHKSGLATLEVNVCGLSESINIDVFDLPTPQVTHPAFLCEGEVTTVMTTNPFSGYRWLNESGGLVSIIGSPSLLPGSYEVEVTDVNGCVGKTVFTIEELPAPNIRISSPDDTGICLTTSDPFPSLYALDSEEGYTYEWYLDNVSLGVTTPIIATSTIGWYSLEVTDINGCTNRSNLIRVFDFCDPCPGGVCNGGTSDNPLCEANTGGISFSYAVTGNCDEITFTNTSVDYTVGSLIWEFGDPPSGGDNLGTGEVITHRFTNAGFYTVELFGEVEDIDNLPDSCISWKAEVITVPISAHFEIFNACPGQDIEFVDLSTFLVGNTITDWSWDFGDPASGANNVSNLREPVHNFTVPGAYDVTLSISDGACTSTFRKTINIRPYPDPTFNLPDVNCEATASLFDAMNTEQVSLWSWDFGDPASGAANFSIQKSAYHTYESPGLYTVTLTAQSIYGCTNTYTDIIEIEGNSLSGDIVSSEGNTICEGETTDLNSPAGGISWEWSTGETNESISVADEDIYSVTVTDTDGCQFIPSEFSLTVLPAPLTSIAAVAYNEFDVVIMSTYDHYETCEGEDIYIEAGEIANHSYVWSTGMPGTLLEFSEDRNNLLTAGDYDYTLDLTNDITGCSNEIGPFTVTVHPLPDEAVIVSSQMGYLCAGDQTTLTISNYDSANDYLWNTGEQTSSISVETPGVYYVKVYNEFGCENESNEITVNAAPDIGLIPSGCLERCNPDTLCLPAIPNIATYQWYFDGSPVSAPNGTSADFIADQSGTYYVELTDIFGCTAQSDPLTLDLIDPLGTIHSSAFWDVNDDGVLDAGDTPLDGIKFYLNDGAAIIDSVVSDINGLFNFENVPSVAYTVTVDLSTVDPTLESLLSSYSVTLLGCDDETDLLVLFRKVCGIVTTTDPKSICSGDLIDINGEMIGVDTTIVVNAMDVNGCDSISTVIVTVLNTHDVPVEEYVCFGESYDNEGSQVLPGQSFVKNLQNQNGCDSLVTVNILAYDEITFDLTAEDTCPNGSDGVLEINNVNGTSGNIEYSLDGINFTSSDVFDNLPSGLYQAFVRDDNGCMATGNVEVYALEELSIEMDNALMLECDQSDVTQEIVIASGDLNGLEITWSDGSTGPTASFEEAGIYEVTVSNTCESLTTTFEIMTEDPTANFQMANVFSPNGDGRNDYLRMDMYDDENVEIMNFKVFDRWGGLVYNYNGDMKAWDGKRAGKILPEGVYIYMLEAVINDCHTTKKINKIGDITLVR